MTRVGKRETCVFFFFIRKTCTKMTMWYYVTCCEWNQQETAWLLTEWKKDCKVKRKWNFYVCVLFSLCCRRCRFRRLRCYCCCCFFHHITISFLFNYYDLLESCSLFLTEFFFFVHVYVLGYDVSCTNLYHSNKQLFVVSFAFFYHYLLLHFLYFYIFINLTLPSLFLM